MTSAQGEMLEALKDCATVLDQFLNGQSLPLQEDVDAALTRANAAIREPYQGRVRELENALREILDNRDGQIVHRAALERAAKVLNKGAA